MNDRTRTDPPRIRPAQRHGKRRIGVWALLIGGVLAWLIALVTVLLLRDEPAQQGELHASPGLTAVVRAGDQPTLGAVTAVPTVTQTATSTRTPVPTLTWTPSPSATVTRIPLLSATPSPGTATLAATATPYETPPPTQAPAATAEILNNGCVVPPGWERYVVQQGDTLFAFVLGAGPEAGLSVDALIAANCLQSRYLSVGQVLYLPPGAAENAPPSEPYVAPEVLGQRGPRPAACPCTISVAAGWRREQIAEAVQASRTSFTGADFLVATGPGVSTPYDFANARPAEVSLEGYLFPGTYTVQNDTTAEQFRDMLLAAFDANVSAQVRADAAAQGVSFHQALAIASIVQREVGGPETQKLVASVYYNNLRAGGRLGSTVTVQYALGRSGAWWPRVRGSDLNVDSPYNTYKYPGLPPGPISNPGLSAILAAVYPPQTSYRFHTMACDGSGEVFAETYEQHLANVNCQ